MYDDNVLVFLLFPFFSKSLLLPSLKYLKKMKFLIASTLLLSTATAFTNTNLVGQSSVVSSPLFMGRAAAVRAATKSKTDAKKAKTNAVFGKKIIMAVKQGGSPDPNSNRMLGDIIKQAKANSVPVDNINRAIKRATEGSAGDFSESTFEAYGFGGASLGKQEILGILSLV